MTEKNIWTRRIEVIRQQLQRADLSIFQRNDLAALQNAIQTKDCRGSWGHASALLNSDTPRETEEEYLNRIEEMWNLYFKNGHKDQ